MRKSVVFLLLALCSLSALGLLGLLAFNPLDGEPRSDLLQFVGRFHPVVLHLPIGLVLLLALMETRICFKNGSGLRPAINLVLVFSILSVIAAVITGFLLAWGSGSDEPLVLEHMQSGILLGVASLALGALRLFEAKAMARIAYRLVLVVALFLLFHASHEGGSITHGRDYLTKHMPQSLRPLFGLEVEKSNTVSNQDDLIVFLNLIQPVIEGKCQSCHNPDKLKGELNLETYKGHLAGGEMGPAVVPFDLENSEMIYRITLPPDDDEFMPPEDEPALSEEEVALIEWWIRNGAPESAKLSEIEDIPSPVEHYIENIFSSMLSR